MEFQRSIISPQDKEAIDKRDADIRELEKQEAELANKKRLNLAPRFSDARFENFDSSLQPVAFKIAKEWRTAWTPQTRKGLYLYGLAGSGKTHLAAAIGNDLMQTARPRFISSPELLLQIKKTYNNQHSDDELIDRMSYTKLLIIDDIGSEKPTEWVQETLFVIIDRRYTNYLPTIFTSNLSLDQLQERLGYRIASRIAEMSEVVELKKVDYRIRKP